MNEEELETRMSKSNFTPDFEQLKDNLQLLESKLKDKEWQNEVLQIISGAVEGVPLRGLDRNLIDNLTKHLDEEAITSLLLTVLVNNNPHIYETQGVKVPPKSEAFLRKITRLYGTKVHHSVREYYSPQDWRHITSEALTREETQETRLYSRILKWNGQINIITSQLPDVIKFIDHFVRNLTVKFRSFNRKDAEEMLKRIDQLRDHINALEKKIESNIKEPGK